MERGRPRRSSSFDDRGLIPVIVQDAENGDVLMFAWSNREALERTIAEGRMVYWSRSRQELWRKGDTSGHVQHWEELRADCDGDVLLARVHQEGAACHTGERSCFHPLAQLTNVPAGTCCVMQCGPPPPCEIERAGHTDDLAVRVRLRRAARAPARPPGYPPIGTITAPFAR